MKKLIIFFIIIAFIIGCLFISKYNEIDINSEIVTKLYNYLGSDDYEICEGLNSYQDKRITYDDINDEIKICNAYYNLDKELKKEVILDKTKNDNCIINKEISFGTDGLDHNTCSLEKINILDLKNKYKEIYNEELNDINSFLVKYNYICVKDNEYYYCGVKNDYTYKLDNNIIVYRSIKKAIKNKDNIIIYDYILKTKNNECISNNKECNSLINKDISYKDIKKYGIEYKHVYKLKDNNYYWYSTEKI